MDLEKKTHKIKLVHLKGNMILILGSFPSRRSLEEGFYYAHKQNRFWKVISMVFDEETPSSKEEKINFLNKHGISLYDSLEECEIEGSSDSSIRKEVPSDLSFFLSQKGEKRIIFNGKAAERYFRKYQCVGSDVTLYPCPSTSPANAKDSLQYLVECYKKAILG